MLKGTLICCSVPFFFFQIVLVLPICCASLGGETGVHFSQNYMDQTDAFFFFFFCQSDTISMPILCGTTAAVHGNWAKTVFIASRNVPFLSKKNKNNCASSLC